MAIKGGTTFIEGHDEPNIESFARSLKEVRPDRNGCMLCSHEQTSYVPLI
jgi:hypothetical protein